MYCPASLSPPNYGEKTIFILVLPPDLKPTIYLGKITLWKNKYHCAHAEKSKIEKKLTKVTSKKSTDKTIKTGIKEFLATTKLTKGQQKVLMNPEMKWTKNSDEDITQALVLRCLSSKAFETLRKERKLYYPSRHTIERHLDGMLHCRPGYVLNFSIIINTMINDLEFGYSSNNLVSNLIQKRNIYIPLNCNYCDMIISSKIVQFLQWVR